MNDVLKALDRKEEVTILYRGKIKGRLLPASDKPHIKAEDHPFFGINKQHKKSVLEVLTDLRESRTHVV
jgi:hypothetical protein